jgi:hypothetical protein
VTSAITAAVATIERIMLLPRLASLTSLLERLLELAVEALQRCSSVAKAGRPVNAAREPIGSSLALPLRGDKARAHGR